MTNQSHKYEASRTTRNGAEYAPEYETEHSPEYETEHSPEYETEHSPEYQGQDSPEYDGLPHWPPGGAYQPRVPLGNVAKWLVRNIIVTGLNEDRLDPRDLLRELGKENPRDDLGHWGGHTRAEVMARARELMPRFPVVTYQSGDPDRPRKNGVLVGVRLRYPNSNNRPDSTHREEPENGAGNNSRNGAGEHPRPKRTCAFCPTDITQSHPNTRKCPRCRSQRRTTTHVREGQYGQRQCLDCNADISAMHHKSTRCAKCAPEHKIEYARQHRAAPRSR